MRLLLDTHVVLWALGEPDRLAGPARVAIADGANVVYVSAATVWEIAIKRALGKLEAPEDLVATLARTGFRTLDIAAAHAERVGALPAIHADPFDRMLVAQAQHEDLVLVTRDARLGGYAVTVMAG